MNQQRTSYRPFRFSPRILVRLAVAAFVAAAICALSTVIAAIVNADTNTITDSTLLTGAFLVVAIWLLVTAVQRRAAQRRYGAYVAYISELQGLLSLTPKEFELAIVELCKFWGYANARHTGGGGDLAADIICHDTAGNMTVVQCKRFAPGHLVGSPEVQKFIGMIVAHHRAQYGIFVTTSGYTEPALTLGRSHSIRMIDGAELVKHMQQFRAAMEQRQAEGT
jgi:HJR/Mrr/RecB family endonuclease